MFNEREQPTGEAYVEFSSPDDRERAMTKDRQHMGGRYVELFRVGRAEMIQALEQFVGGYMNSQSMQMQGGMGGAAAYAGMYGAMQGAPYGSPGFLGGPACGGPGAYGAMPQQIVGGMQAGMQAGAVPGATGQPMGKAGTLRMRGLPFRSTVDDIFRFFTGFQIMPGGIVIGQRDGRASGDISSARTSDGRRLYDVSSSDDGTLYHNLPKSISGLSRALCKYACVQVSPGPVGLDLCPKKCFFWSYGPKYHTGAPQVLSLQRPQIVC